MNTYEGQELFDLTDPQKGIILDTCMESKETQRFANAEGIYLLDKNGFDPKAMNKAFNLIVEQNDALRIRIIRQGFKNKQLFNDYIPFELPIVNVDDIAGVHGRIKSYLKVGVGNYDEKLWQAELASAKDGTGALIIRFNHLCIDGYTLEMMFIHLGHYYEALKAGEEPKFEKTGSYKDYISSEKKYLESSRFKDDAKWWKDLYSSRLFSKFGIPSGIKGKNLPAARYDHGIGLEFTEEIDTFCKENGMSSASLFLAGAAILIEKLTHKKHFEIFTLVHGRSTIPLRRTMGCMVGSTQIEYRMNDEEKIADYLVKSYKAYLESMQHSRYAAQRNALYICIENIFNGFQYPNWLIFNNLFFERMEENPTLETGYIENSEFSMAQFHADIDLSVRGYTLMLQFPREYFTDGYISGMVDRYFDIIRQLVRFGDKKLSEITLLDVPETKRNKRRQRS